MSTAAIPEQHPHGIAKPIDQAKTNIHWLLRRGLRLVTPSTLEDEADRGRALRRLNEDAQAFHEWKKIEDQASDAMALLKPVIQASVVELGVVPDSAPKSQRVETRDFECTVTTGETMGIDDDAVFEFDMQMHTPRQQQIFNQLFTRVVKYRLAPTARQLMEHGKLPPQHEEMIRGHYVRAFSAETTTPKLSVVSKSEAEEKRQKAITDAAEKAAKKRATKAGA